MTTNSPQVGEQMRGSGKTLERVSKSRWRRLGQIIQRTAVEPFLTASWAYSTWSRWPSGEKTVIALSYLADIVSAVQSIYRPAENSKWLRRFPSSTKQSAIYRNLPSRSGTLDANMTTHFPRSRTLPGWLERSLYGDIAMIDNFRAINERYL